MEQNNQQQQLKQSLLKILSSENYWALKEYLESKKKKYNDLSIMDQIDDKDVLVAVRENNGKQDMINEIFDDFDLIINPIKDDENKEDKFE
jgi:hypothetical protein